MNYNNIFIYGVRPWKRQAIKSLLGTGNKYYFNTPIEKIFHMDKENVSIFIWASEENNAHKEIKSKYSNKYFLIEDGFIRSSGLGIKLYQPGSISISKKGIHFDSTRESDLEIELNTYECKSDEIERSKKLIQLINEKQISKYGVSTGNPFPSLNNNKKNILIIGQVEDDASIKYGSPVIKTNLELIKEVKKKYPNENLFYKPHPDVKERLRLGEVSPTILKDLNIFEITDTPLHECIKNCDETIVITSQSGLDALLMGKPVTCYGIPFYSGWGLTNDIYKCDRRIKERTLEELIYISFIKYPLYINPKTNKLCEVETLIEIISDIDYKWPQAPLWMQKLVKIKRFIRKIRNATK